MLDSNILNKARIYSNAFHITIANFIFGYTIGVFNTCQDNVAYSMGWSRSEKTLYTTLFSTFIPVGAFFGSSVTALLCNKIGRLRCILVMDAIIIIGSILSGFHEKIVFGLGRLISGFGIGICLAIAPIYLSEMTPQSMMGTVGPLMTLMLSFGLTLSYGFAFVLPSDDLSQGINNFWTFMFILPGIVALYQAIYFLYAIKFDTPLFYVREKNYEKYFQVLRLYYDDSSLPSLEEVSTLERCPKNIRFINVVTYKQLLCDKTYSKMLRIGLILAFFQQLSGVNAIIFYSFSIYRSIGLSVLESKVFTLMIGFTFILSAILTIWLLEFVGRKKLLLWGHGLISIDLLLIGLISQFSPAQVYVLAGLIVIYFVFFAIGLSATLWSYIGEIQTEKAVALSVALNYIANIIINLLFPFAVASVGISAVFYFFCVCMSITVFYIIVDTIETKGMKKEEIELILFKNKNENHRSKSDVQILKQLT